MRYQGGKSLLAADIVSQMSPYLDQVDAYYEPFIGGGSVMSKVPDILPRIGSDANGDLIAMYQALQRGDWEPPDVITEDEFHHYKYDLEARATLDAPTRAFMSFSTFGGVQWRAYPRSSTGTNFAAQDKRGLLAKMLTMQTVTFVHCDYRHWASVANAVIYCDPPYAGTLQYYDKDNPNTFDSDAFWRQVQQWAKQDNYVFISEFNAPDFAVEVWQRERHVMTRPSKRQDKVVDRLYCVTERPLLVQGKLF